MQNFNITRKKLLIATIALTGLILVIIGIWFIATHGIVRVKKTGNSSYTIIPFDTDHDEGEKTTASFKIVPSGSYILELKDDTGLQQKNVTVPSWLGSVQVSLATTQQKIERIAGETLDHITPLSDGNIASFSTNPNASSLYFVHSKNDPSGNGADIKTITPAQSSGAVTNGQLVSLLSGTESITPYLYGRGFTSPGSPLIGVNATSSLPHITPTSASNDGHFALSSTDSGNSFDIYENLNRVQSITNLSGVSHDADGNIMASVAGNWTAIGFGKDSQTFLGEGEEGSENGLKENETAYLVKIYDTSKGEANAEGDAQPASVKKTLNLGRDAQVDGISISTDGTRLAVVDARRLTIYNTATFEKLFSYEGTSYSTPIWIGNSKLIFADHLNGVLAYSDKERSVSSLITPGILTVTNMTIDDENIYFTATRESDAGDMRPAIDGYVIHMNTAANDNNILVKKLPYSSDEIIIKTMNGIIYASSAQDDPSQATYGGFEAGNVSQDIKNKVEAYLKQNIPDYQKYSIVYGRYL